MANSPQAKKRIRQTARRTTANRMRLSRIRTYVRNVEQAIASGDADAAKAALRAAEPELARGARHGVVSRNMASRKVSRLSARIKSLSA